jgi:hypothetical protein
MPTDSLHLNLDNAWPPLEHFTTLDLLTWGPKLRYHGKRSQVESFYQSVRPHLTDFVLYGSGDFHYLAALLLRRVTQPVTVVSFDNHPDWDVRPPRWACGGWVNRALELPHVRRVSVWGCGNFELAYPSLLFANHTALRNGYLEVHPWHERQPPAVRKRFDCMTRDNWRTRFSRFASAHAGEALYVTIDLDCLAEPHAATDWEPGLFTPDDLAWALTELRRHTRLIAGDLCGARSPQSYARPFQRFAARWDHPKPSSSTPPVNSTDSADRNLTALNTIWPALAGQGHIERLPP